VNCYKKWQRTVGAPPEVRKASQGHAFDSTNHSYVELSRDRA
jgi:hypothetical protein